MELFILCFELIGTVAFALSGAMKSFVKEMDIFGSCILALTTAVGGGIIRDLILGATPPAAFVAPTNALIAIGIAIIAFIPAIRSRLTKSTKIYENTLLIADSAGLGIFTVCGMAVTINLGYGDNLFLTLFTAVLTGVGGGVLRDIFAGDRPYIFIKHIYACASLVGAGVCRLLWNVLGPNVSMLIGFAVIIVIRLCSAKFRWSLPKASAPVEKD